ncbi:MAG: virulence RhuM family protein, partial [Candidatus Heimdallarchaeota archaeon]|nr:virulence RhuM family protein [Candidatus Heimdallarchaeota archaeon]
MKQRGEIIIYKTNQGTPNIKVRLENNSLWLDQYQISELFQTDRTSIVRHIRNIYTTVELDESSTCVKIAQVQNEGRRRVRRQINIYNLDLIISVGYRVNSKRGTQFRIWSNKIIREHLFKGYTRNENRLNELKKTIQLINRTSKQISINDTETNGLIDVLSDYSMALDILDDYDHQRLQRGITNSKIGFKLNYEKAKGAIEKLRKKFGGSDLFGNEKDDSFQGS